MTERLVSKLHVALLSYDEREIRVRKNYLEEQNPAICCVCFHSGEELLRELLLDLRSSTDIGIFWVLPFCKQLYAEWGIQQPDVNCEYLTTALQVVCGTERKLAVRKEILQTVAEEHHTTVAAVDCGMRRLIDGVEKYNTEAWQKFKQDYGLMGHSVTLGKLIYAGRQKLIDSGTQGRKAGR